MKEKEKKHIDEYDWIRVIATILVVIGHSSYLSISTLYGGVNYKLPSTVNSHYYDWICSMLRYISTWVYQFHMPLFFSLSGAVFALAKETSFFRVLFSKVKRLLFPYIVYGILFMFPLKYWAGFYEKDKIGVAICSYFRIAECGHLWFFPSLFWCFITFLLIRKIGKGNPILVFFIAYFIQKSLPYVSKGYLGMPESLQYLMYFVIGFYFEKCIRDNRRDFNIRNSLWKLLMLTILVITSSGGLINPEDFVCILVKVYWIYSIANILVNTVGSVDRVKKMIRTLANYCFYIYVFHDPLEYVVLKLAFEGDWLSTGIGVYFYFFARTILVYFLSLILGMIIVNMRNIRKNVRNLGI